MANEWQTMATFTTNEVIRAGRFQDIWLNLDSLKNPAYAEKYLPGPSRSTWTTTSTSFAVIDGANFALDFESFGNPVLIGASIHCQHSVAAGRSSFDFRIDGTQIGESSGLFRHVSSAGPEETEQTLIIVDLAAGTHNVTVMYKTDVAGTLTVWKNTALKLFILEF